jgi:hypothetical protein
VSNRLPLQSSVHDTANGFMMLLLPQCACWQAWQFTPQIMCCYEPGMQAGAPALYSSFAVSAHTTIVPSVVPGRLVLFGTHARSQVNKGDLADRERAV